MLFEEAMGSGFTRRAFEATVYAMNTLLIHKGVYTQEEFQAVFVEWVEKDLVRREASAQRSEVNFVSSWSCQASADRRAASRSALYIARPALASARRRGP